MDRLIAHNKLSHSELLSVTELSPVDCLSAENEDDEAFVLQVKEHLRVMTGFVLSRSRPSLVSKPEANLSCVHLQTRQQGSPLCGMSCLGPWRMRCTQH